MAAEPTEQVAKVVFVCTGNRARSALAAALLLRHAGDVPLVVESRGTSDVGAAPVLPEMLRAGALLELDLSEHRAAALGRGEFADADLVLGFEQYHVASAVVDGGAARSRTFTLPELVGLAPDPPRDSVTDVRQRIALVADDAHGRRAGAQPPEIRDPLGASSEEFRDTAMAIDRLVQELARLVLGRVDSRTPA